MERCFGYAVDATGTLAIAPNATVTVYETGTLNLAAIYADQLGTPKSNPFSPNTYGYFYFYAAGGRYDVRFSGSGITNAFTWGDIQLQDSYNMARTDTANTFNGNQSIVGNLTVSGDATFSGNPLIVDGKIPSLSSSFFSSLSGANLTGLSADNLSTGTLASARLSGTYSQALTFSNVLNVLAGATLALGTTPASSGVLRLPYNEGVFAKNSSNVDTELFRLGTSDKLEVMELRTTHMWPLTDDTANFGDETRRYRNGHIKDLYTSIIAFGTSLVSTTGAIRLGNDTTYAIGFRTAADSGNKLLYLNASDQFVLGSDTSITGNLYPSTDEAYDIGSASKAWRNLDLIGTATIASLKVGNGLQLQLSGGSYATLLSVNGSDQLVIGDSSHNVKFAKAIDVPNSGVATLGVLPAGASTFSGWLPVISSTGTQVWIPCFQ